MTPERYWLSVRSAAGPLGIEQWPTPASSPPRSVSDLDLRAANLAAAVRVQALLEDARAVESSDALHTVSLYRAALVAENERREFARSTPSVFASHEVETSLADEIAAKLRKAEREARR